MDKIARETLRSSESEGGCFGGLRRRNEGYHGFKPVLSIISSAQSAEAAASAAKADKIRLAGTRPQWELSSLRKRVESSFCCEWSNEEKKSATLFSKVGTETL